MYVDTNRGLKVDRRDISGPAVRDGVPSSRWPVIESFVDVCPATLEVLVKYFFAIFVIH